MSDIHKLCIVSHVVHYRHNGKLYAYGPYTREIDLWADLFHEVVIAAPCREEPPTCDSAAITRSNISIIPQKETGGNTPKAKVAQLLLLPVSILGLVKAMRQADAIHVRCPGNLGLLGVALAPLFSRYRVAKYAGQWNGYPGESWTVRLQRGLLRSRWWRSPVTVYGTWPKQPPHVVPFFTSVLTSEQSARASAVSGRRRVMNPLRILFVGRLSAAKNVDVLISAIATLRAEALQLQCVIVGEGPLRPTLEAQVSSLKLSDCVTFEGGVDFERVLGFYEEAEVLVLASETEGWPKAIAEGMAFGLICIGSNRGLVPEILGDGRGIIVPPGDKHALTTALRRIAMSPQDFQTMRARAADWTQKYSLESLRQALKELLDRWGPRSLPNLPR